MFLCLFKDSFRSFDWVSQNKFRSRNPTTASSIHIGEKSTRKPRSQKFSSSIWGKGWVHSNRSYDNKVTSTYKLSDPFSLVWKESQYFYSPLDGMRVYCRVIPGIRFASTHYLCTLMERGTVRVECLAQENITMSLARAPTQIAWSRVEHSR